MRTVGFMRGFRISGFRRLKLCSIAMGIVKSRYAISQWLRKQCGSTGVGDVDRWHFISGFRSENFRNKCIRIRDIAKSKIPIEVTGC
jgi:hypothetical protein